MSTRSAILKRIKAKNDTASAEDIASAARALVAHPPGIQPTFDRSDLLARFIAKATSERVTASVEDVRESSDIPDHVRVYMADQGLPPRLSVQPIPSLRDLSWSGFELVENAQTDGGVGVTFARYGIAETGSLVVHSGPDSPILGNFLPLHHIVVLRKSDILACLEDVWPHLGGAGAPQHRLLTLITGTSGTADIEARNVRGAHGPRHMHILLIP